MTRKRPRVLATLLLGHLGPRGDSLSGDLVEEWRAGRSSVWYWRQVLGGIAFHFIEDVRGHWVIALRSILIGLVILWSFGWLIALIEVMTEPWVHRTLMYRFGITFMQFKVGFYLHIVNLMWGSLIAGWVVARLHDRHRATAILGLVLTLGVLAVSNERFSLSSGTRWDTSGLFLIYWITD